MIEKFKGIIVKLSDFKEADKLATIFSLEYGVLTAKFAGVKKDKAKFKAVAQPFAFADFVVAEKGSSLTITQADIIDDFPKILQNYNKTICAYIVLDMVRSIIPAQKPENDLFLLTLTALKNIEKENEYVAIIQYILNFFKFSGLQLDFVEKDIVYLDTLSGNFSPTRQENSLLIDKKVYATLKEINKHMEHVAPKSENEDKLLKNKENLKENSLSDEEENSLKVTSLKLQNKDNLPAQNNNNKENLIAPNEKENFNPNTLKQAVRLLHNVIYLKFGADIKSFEFI